MSLNDIPLVAIDGEPASLAPYAAKVKLIVNVASRCGLSPQYKKLEDLQKTYGDRGFTVLGFPSNQFLQELGSSEAIKEFCSTTYGVTFPMFEKIRVNGRSQHRCMSVSIGELSDRSPALLLDSPGVTRLRGAGLTLHRQGQNSLASTSV
jgi:glutathione peroxidase-family protein